MERYASRSRSPADQGFSATARLAGPTRGLEFTQRDRISTIIIQQKLVRRGDLSSESAICKASAYCPVTPALSLHPLGFEIVGMVRHGLAQCGDDEGPDFAICSVLRKLRPMGRQAIASSRSSDLGSRSTSSSRRTSGNGRICSVLPRSNGIRLPQDSVIADRDVHGIRRLRHWHVASRKWFSGFRPGVPARGVCIRDHRGTPDTRSRK